LRESNPIENKIFRSGTDLVSLLIIFHLVVVVVVVVVVGATSTKKAQGFVGSNRIGMKFDSVVLQVNTHRLTESDFRALSTWRPRRNNVRQPLSAAYEQRPPAVR